jgi:hypothetical protein
MNKCHTFVDANDNLAISRIHSLELLAANRRDKLVTDEQTNWE